MTISLSTKNIRKKTKCSRKYLAKAALYRRIITNDNIPEPNYVKTSDAFSLEKLLELYEFESRGTINGERGAKLSRLIHQNNGYAYGKHLYDIFTSQMVLDIKDGLFYKCEFLETDLQILHNKPILDNVLIDPNKIKYPFPTEYVKERLLERELEKEMMWENYKKELMRKTGKRIRIDK